MIRGRRIIRHVFAFIGVITGGLVALVDPDVTDDYFRIFALAMAVYIILFSARIVAMNYRMTKKFHGRGVFLPIHIMSIATSYMILIISTHAWVIDRIGEGSFFWFGLPLIVAADVIGVFALGVIWRFQCEKKEAMEDESVPR